MPAQPMTAPPASPSAGGSGGSDVVSFRQAAARHRTRAYTLTFTSSGQTVQQVLNRSGYLAAFRCHLTASIVVGTAAVTWTATGLKENYFPLVSLRSPQGDYLHSYSLRELIDFQYRMYRSAVQPSANPRYATWSPTSATTQAIDITFVIPISLNLGANFQTGLLMRQIANNDFILSFTLANPADIGSGIGTLVVTSTATAALPATLVIEEEWYELVNPAKVVPPPLNLIVRHRNQKTGPLVIGDYTQPYSVGPTLLDGLFRVADGGDTATELVLTNVNFTRVLANKQTEIDNQNIRDLQDQFFRWFGKDARGGVYLHNYFDDMEGCNETRARDFINTARAAQLDFIINTAAAFTTANSYLMMFFRELETLGA